MKNKLPLHYAALYNSKELMEILIEKKVNINAKAVYYHNRIILFYK